MMTTKRAHLIVGIAGVLAFLATGIYMKFSFPELYGGDETLRLMYRTNHVYILLSSLTNLVLGFHLQDLGSGWRASARRLGSWLLILEPFALFFSYCIEVPRADPNRIATSIGVLLLFTGALLHAPAARQASRR